MALAMYPVMHAHITSLILSATVAMECAIHMVGATRVQSVLVAFSNLIGG